MYCLLLVVEVRVQRSRGHLRVEVRDQGGRWVYPAPTDERGGRGLLIVGVLARKLKRPL